MRYIGILLLLGVNLKVNSQQINPVPDYVFRYQMSVGRNAATDSIAYLSVGPKYGAVKGFMPPMVVDTALVTGSAKRNGLLIFSVQKNKFLYWDSVGVKWAEMAGTAGSAVTSTGTANYIPRFATASNLANSAIYQTPGGKIIVGSTTDSTKLFNVAGEAKTGTLTINTNGQTSFISTKYASGTNGNNIFIGNGGQSLAGSTSQASGLTSLGHNSLYSVTKGRDLTAIGFGSLYSDTTGLGNTAVGYQSMYNTTSGNNNNAIGRLSLYSNTTGFNNDAFGVEALYNNTTGYYNVAMGTTSLRANTTGTQNTAIGYESLTANTTGVNNVGVGTAALYSNTTGQWNVAVGIGMQGNTTGSYNVAIGNSALGSTTTDNAIAIGTYAGAFYGTTGYNQNIKSANSIFIGYDSRPADTTQTNQIVIGHESRGKGSNTVTLGNANISGTYLRGETYVATESDNGDYKLQVDGNGWFNGSLTTSDPSGGTKKPWKLGEVATVSPTSPNRTIRVEIDGTVYYIHAKTTND